jgi:hypothetical protein
VNDTERAAEHAASLIARAAPFVESAPRYAELGWTLLRLDGKVPVERGWQNKQPEEPGYVAGKWSVWGKRFNIGVLLGASGLAVVEADTEEGRATLLDLFGGRLPPIPIVETGRGFWHLYFADNGYGNAVRDGLELRAGAQQCVLPPSVHPDTGKPYRWLPGHEPWPS